MRNLPTKKHTLKKSFLIIVILISFVIGIIYVYTSWRSYKSHEAREAIGQAEAAAVFIDPDIVRKLSGSKDDIQLPAYITLKKNLSDLAGNSEIEFAYLFTLKDSKLYFLVDSEPHGSEDYSPPGQEYSEATDQDLLPFVSGKSVLTDPITDRWGTWVSALVPIKDINTDEVIAVLGIDYAAKVWNADIYWHVAHSVIIVICIMLLLFVIYRLLASVQKNGSLSDKLRESESLFRTVFEQAPIGIALVRNQYDVTEINTEYLRITSRTKKEIISLNWADITHPDDLQKDLEKFELFKAGQISGYKMEKRYLKPDGTYSWVSMVIAPLDVTGDQRVSKGHLCIIMDINDQKITEEALRESERSKDVLLSHIPGIAYRCVYDKKWTMLYLSAGCYTLTGYKPEELINNQRLSFSDIICDEYRDILWREWARIIEQKTGFVYEYEITTATGERKWVVEMGQPVLDNNGEVEALEGIIIDVTVPKHAMLRAQYMADHDFLTDLNNRMYFEAAKQEIEKKQIVPVAVIMADINGMRLINDAFGQAEGDALIKKTAGVIKHCCIEDYTIARTGGDEFSILMPYCNIEEAENLVGRIREKCNEFNNSNQINGLIINLSIGYGIKQSPDQTIDSAVQEAEEYLIRHKLLERKSHHNAIMSSIMATMYARSYETEEHAERMSKLSKVIGKKLNLSEKNIVDLELLSILHDIGKIGIDDSILKKPGRLTQEEWFEMKKHPEIGYRIALSVPEFERVAEYVLCHHERWDGKGYPKGLKEDEIPLLSRIIAVVDAYDAMTEDRVYRKAMTHEEALKEISINAGTQFDPYIAGLFIDSVLD